MTWVKIDDQFQDHPSMVGLSMAAIGLWTCGLAYSARYLTDGEIPKKALFRVCPQPDAETIAGELVEAGRWLERDTSWYIAGYLDHNPSRERVEAIRAVRSEAGSAGGHAKAQAEALAREVAKDRAGTLSGKLPGLAMPPSHPIPSLKPSPPRAPSALEEDFEKWWAAYPRKREKPGAKRAYMARRRAGASHADLVKAAERYAASRKGEDAKFTKHPATFLNNGWDDWLPGAVAEAEAHAPAPGTGTYHQSNGRSIQIDPGLQAQARGRSRAEW